jgi:hypothetical protein
MTGAGRLSSGRQPVMTSPACTLPLAWRCLRAHDGLRSRRTRPQAPRQGWSPKGENPAQAGVSAQPTARSRRETPILARLHFVRRAFAGVASEVSLIGHLRSFADDTSKYRRDNSE